MTTTVGARHSGKSDWKTNPLCPRMPRPPLQPKQAVGKQGEAPAGNLEPLVPGYDADASLLPAR
ncbi:MAG: hypothetical protein AAF614_39490 [Chloroflexota bacterium]